MRLGRHFKKMAQRLPEIEATLLWSGGVGKKVHEGLAEKYKVKDKIKTRIEEKILPVIEKAKQRGEKARRTWHACNDPSCAVCGGATPEHFHFSVEGNKDVTLEEFLAKYLSAEEVLGLASLIKNYENLLVILHYETLLLKNLGLLED